MPPGLTNDTPTGVEDAIVSPVPNWPNVLAPQQDMVSSERMAQVCSEPAANESWVKIDPDWKPGIFTVPEYPLVSSICNSVVSTSLICVPKNATLDISTNNVLRTKVCQYLPVAIIIRRCGD